MAISVQFPDGTCRDVPGQLVQISSAREGPARFQQVPVNCDPVWKYERKGDIWIARSRPSAVSTLVPPVQQWWCSIEPMRDDSVDPPSSAAA